MFVIPISVTVLFYFMFGNINQNSEFNVPKTRVILADLDRGSPLFQANLSGGQGAASLGSVNSLGGIIQIMLQSPEFSSLLEVSTATDAASARSAVDRQKAGVAIIIPENFSAAFMDTGQHAELELYQDPTLTLGPGVVKSILDQLMDSFSGAKIAVEAAATQSQGNDPSQGGTVLQLYLAAASTQAHDTAAVLETQAPAQTKKTTSALLAVVTQIMGGMMVFYSFYTGTASAQTILQEDENGTLSRLFTTPTAQSTILGGKFLAVGLTVIVQISTLVVFSVLVFGIRWGAPVSVALAVIGTLATSTSMGIFINSLLKSTRQGGAVFGGLLTITGMVGMMPIFTQGLANKPPFLEIVSLLVPQGWAIRGLFQAVNGESVVVSLLVLLAISLVFFVAGIVRFSKRFA
jgi:ABC-2 type transport system permease protein